MPSICSVPFAEYFKNYHSNHSFVSSFIQPLSLKAFHRPGSVLGARLGVNSDQTKPVLHGG